jgi:hypothetical protein
MVHPAGGYSGNVYWYGGYYSGANYTQSHFVQILYTSILTPASGPRYNDMYFNLLSAFDTNGYYDQLGFSSDYCSGCQNSGSNTWAVAYEQGWSDSTHLCGYTGHIDSAAYKLSTYTWYTFLMYLSFSNLVFKVYLGDGAFNNTPLWTQSFSDSADSFETASTFKGCEGGYDTSSHYDMTLYQEVHQISSTSSMTHPQWDFWFDQTNVAWWSGSTWNVVGVPDSSITANQCWITSGTCPSPAHGYTTYSYNRYIVIANNAMWLYWSTQSYSVSPGSGYSAYGYEYNLGGYCPGLSGYCSVSMSCTVPTGWTGGPSWATPLQYYDYDSYYANSPSGASPGTYYSGCTFTQTSSSPNEFTTFIFLSTVT